MSSIFKGVIDEGGFQNSSDRDSVEQKKVLPKVVIWKLLMSPILCMPSCVRKPIKIIPRVQSVKLRAYMRFR